MASAPSDDTWRALFKNLSSPNLAKRSKTPVRADENSRTSQRYVGVSDERVLKNRSSEDVQRPVLRKRQATGSRPNLHKTSGSTMEITRDLRTTPLHHRPHLSDPTNISRGAELQHTTVRPASGMDSNSSLDSYPPPRPREQAPSPDMQDPHNRGRQFSGNSAYSGYVDMGPPPNAPVGSNMPTPPINIPQNYSDDVDRMPMPRMRAISGPSPPSRHHRPPPVSTLPPVLHFPPPPSTAPPTRIEFHESPVTPLAYSGFPTPPLTAGPSSRLTYGHNRAKSSTDLRSKSHYERPFDQNVAFLPLPSTNNMSTSIPLPSTNNMPTSIAPPARRQTRKSPVPVHACLSLSRTDRIRLIKFPSSVTQVVKDAILRSWAKGIQAEKENAGSTEFQLRGNPWTGQGDEAIPAIYMMCEVSSALYHLGWTLAMATDLSKRAMDKDTMIYRSGDIPPPCSFMAVSFHEGDRLRLVRAPVEVINAVKNTWGGNIQKESWKLENVAWEFKLIGNPWWSVGDEAISVRILLLNMLDVLSAYGWEVHTSLDMTAGPGGLGKNAGSDTDCWILRKPTS